MDAGARATEAIGWRTLPMTDVLHETTLRLLWHVRIMLGKHCEPVRIDPDHCVVHSVSYIRASSSVRCHSRGPVPGDSEGFDSSPCKTNFLGGHVWDQQEPDAGHLRD